MDKFAKILKLSDPYPTFWYEASCYLKAALATILLLLGIFFIFYFFFLGIIFIVLAIYFFSTIKLVRDLVKIIKG